MPANADLPDIEVMTVDAPDLATGLIEPWHPRLESTGLTVVKEARFSFLKKRSKRLLLLCCIDDLDPSGSIRLFQMREAKFFGPFS